MAKQAKSSARKNIEYVPTRSFRLDAKNPRLILPESASQELILKTLYQLEALEALAHSISSSGFFVEEPLVVIPDERKKGTFVVVEGNRRLATVLILCDAEKQKRLKVRGWPSPDQSIVSGLKKLPCVKHDTRDEVEAFLVFRHITGIKKWDFFQRARYVAGLIESDTSVDDIEAQIGDDVGTIKKLYQNYVVFRHLRNDTAFDVRPVVQNFSLMEVALGQRPLKRFLGLPHRLPTEAVESLVEDEHLDELRELATWIYGDESRGVRPVIAESRDISDLARVVAHRRALDYLRQSRDLEGATERCEDERDYLLRLLVRSERTLGQALGEARQHKEDQEVQDHFKRLSEVFESLRELLT